MEENTGRKKKWLCGRTADRDRDHADDLDP